MKQWLTRLLWLVMVTTGVALATLAWVGLRTAEHPGLRRDLILVIGGLMLCGRWVCRWLAGRATASFEAEQRHWAQRLLAGESVRQAPRLGPLFESLAPAWQALQAEASLQRQAAARLQPVLESLDTAVIAVDGGRRLLYANPAARRMFSLGAAPPPGSRGAALLRIPQLRQWLDDVQLTGSAAVGRVDLPDDRILQVEVTPLETVTLGMVVLARDVTGMIQLETMRRDFIAAVSHELRTPLTSILGYAETLLQEPAPTPPEQRRFLAVILQNATRLTRLAQDLVTLSSIETGTYPFHFQEVEAAALVGPALDVVTPAARKRGCRIVVEALARGRVRGDPDALHRVLLNLLDNAIIHGGSDTQIFVRGAVVGKNYELVVRDTGTGIGSLDQRRIFERFYRVDKSHSQAGGGSGLGLALVKHIVKEHGGVINLESTLGMGSTFRLRLPLAHNAGDGPVAGPATQPMSQAAGPLVNPDATLLTERP